MASASSSSTGATYLRYRPVSTTALDDGETHSAPYISPDPDEADEILVGRIFMFSLLELADGSDAVLRDCWGARDLIYLPKPREWNYVPTHVNLDRLAGTFSQLKTAVVDAHVLTDLSDVRGLKAFLDLFPRIRRVVVADTWARDRDRAPERHSRPGTVRARIEAVAAAPRPPGARLVVMRADIWDGACWAGRVHTVAPTRDEGPSGTGMAIYADLYPPHMPGPDIDWEAYIASLNVCGSAACGSSGWPWEDDNMGNIILCGLWVEPCESADMTGPESWGAEYHIPSSTFPGY